MTASHRQLVRDTLARRPPAAPPFTWGFGPTPPVQEQLLRSLADAGIDWDELRRRSEHVAWCHPKYVGDRVPQGTADYMGIWGIRTRAVDYGAGVYSDEIAHCPLAGVDSVAALGDHPWPSPDAFDYSDLPVQLARLDPEGTRAVRLSGGNPLEIYQWMTGLEEAMMNLIAEPDIVRAALDRIAAFFKEHLRRQIAALDGRVDLIQFADDLGSQQGPLLSRELYRDLVQPYHRDLIAHARSLAPEAIIAHHSDGSVFRLLPDLIDAGVQCLEAVQIECAEMEPALLKKTFGDRLAFQGAISVQQLLPRASADEVRRACRELVAVLGRGGGYLPAPSHAIQAGTPTENILAMLEGVLGEERFAAVREGARSG